MKNIVKDLEKNCKDCCDPEKTVKFLASRGDISYTSEFYREIWFFYKDALNLFPKSRQQRRLAREHTIEMLGISEKVFRSAREKMKVNS